MFDKIKGIFQPKSFIRINIVNCSSNRVEYEFETSEDLDRYFLKKDMFVELVDDPRYDLTAVPKSILIIPAVCNVLPIIWLFDSTLLIDELDKAFYKSIPKIKQGYQDMYKKASFKGKIKANSLKDNTYEHETKYLSFFSAGVDSVCMALRYIDDKPNLITLWGSDIPLKEENSFKILQDNVNGFANDYGLNSFFVKTDFRLILKGGVLYQGFAKDLKEGGNWWHELQHGIAIISHSSFLAYLLKVECILFASSHHYTQEDISKRQNLFSCASSPIIDEEIKFASCSVKHDGWEFSRKDKIGQIIDFKNENDVSFNLHVCWFTTTGKNCNVCEKCARTYFNLMAKFEDPKDYGFDITEENLIQVKNNFKDVLDNKKVPGWGLTKFGVITWKENQELFKQNEEYWRETEFSWFLDIDFDEIIDNYNR